MKEKNKIQDWRIEAKFLSKELCDILENHFDLSKANNRCTYGDINGFPMGKAWDLYGDSFCESIGIHKTPVANKWVNGKLNLAYGLMREYEKGAELRWHRDRWQCEYSCTVQISDKPWPIHMSETYIGGVWGADASIILQRGDAVFYKGCEIYHCRTALEHETSRHLFLHYVDKDSALDNYDSRPNHGISKLQMLPRLKAVRGGKRVAGFTTKGEKV